MSIFDTNITEEEKLSGYSASEQGDETFKLETLGNYPGVFPDFIEKEEPLVPLESAFEDNEEDFEEDFEDIFDDEFEDDDFKNILENDLSKNKQNSDISNLDNFSNDESFSTNESFPIDDEILADVINFDDIKADKPSNYGIDAIGEEDNTDPKSIDEIKKNKKKEKSKKLFYIYGSVAALLLISLITVTFLNKDRIFNSIVSNGDSTFVDNKIDSSKSSKSTNVNKSKIKLDSNKKEIAINRDSINKSVEINDSNSLDLNGNNIDIVKDKEKENIVTKDDINNQHINKNSNVNTNKTQIEDTKIVSNDNVINKTKELPKAKNITKDNNITNNSNIRNIEEIERKKSVSNSIQKDEKEKINNIPYPKKDLSDEGIFIVRIYATQSKEDALFWLNKLKDQKIYDGFISEQIIRDEIWYRVRFGNFTNKDKALEEASKLGYAQTWVDRVK